MARPREDHVPVLTGWCEKHGVVEMRVHKIGRRQNGTQKYRARCPQCHSERNSMSSQCDPPKSTPLVANEPLCYQPIQEGVVCLLHLGHDGDCSTEYEEVPEE